MRRRLVFSAVLITLIAFPGLAEAHGELQGTDPERGSKVAAPPKTVRITFTEAPTADGRFEIVDGCGDEVLAAVGGEGPEAELQVDGGEPGRWKVSYRVISAVDGHSTRGSFRFEVQGKKDCGEPDPARTDGPEDEPAGPSAAPATGEFPTVPVVIGVAVILGAIAVRLLTSRGD